MYRSYSAVPLISVCIPVYNGAPFIADAINSVLNQTFTDFELLIIDNGSTDNTVEITNGYTDKRILVIQNESNIGLIANWNKAIQAARGKYIKILPADDFLYAHCLLLECDVLEKDTEEKISLVCGRRNIISHNGKILFNRGFSKKEQQLNGIKAINKLISSGGNIIGEAGAVLFRKEITKKTGVFNSDIFYVLDIDLWVKILLQGDLYALPDIVCSFRVSESSASVGVVKQQKEDILKFIEKIYAAKEYQLSMYNYTVGKIKAYLLSAARKILYKYVLK